MGEGMFRSFILLGGTPPDLQILRNHPNTKKICADGGALKSMLAQGLCPDIVVGDGDSLDESDRDHPYELVIDSDQENTDFEKCLHHVQSQGLLPALVCGIAGGEIDHQHNNLSTFVKMAKTHPMIFLDAQPSYKHKLGFAVHQNFEAQMRVGSTVSLLPAPNANVSTFGLVWNLGEEVLCMHGRSGARNKVESENVQISVSEGSLIVVADAEAFGSVFSDGLQERNVRSWFDQTLLACSAK